MREKYDVVVIGSGFGGAVTACRLAQAGRSVCVFEQGKRWLPQEFPRSFRQFGGAFWAGSANPGYLEYRVFKGMDVMHGIGVGGGSLHYFGVTLRASPRIFEAAAWPAEISRGVLDPYYDLSRDMLDAATIPHTPAFPLPGRAEALLGAAQATGYPAELVDVAIYVDAGGATRRNPHSGIDQTSCDYNSNCLLGCRIKAKNSLDLNYLPLAERQGAEVHPLHQVEQIEPLGSGGYRVHAKVLDPGEPRSSETISVVADKVVVAAGTLGSNQLLLRNRDVWKTLPGLGAALGTRFSGNGDFPFATTLESDRDVDFSQGPPIASGFDASTPENVIFIEDVGVPNPISWLFTALFVGVEDGKDLLSMIKNYVELSVGFGEGTEDSEDDDESIFSKVRDFVEETLGIGDSAEVDMYQIATAFKNIFSDPPLSRALPYLGMGTDAANGKLFLDEQHEVTLDWSPDASKPMFDQMESALRKISKELGGKYFPCPVWIWPLRKTITAHPLGGCFMGDDAASSVVNPRGEVWGHPGLYVIDGSMIPTALAVNPSMTIAALAERCSFWMIHGREMAAGDSQAPSNR